MVLDAKAMEWASANGIDTAKLKAAKIPIYGKWYFPDIPANVALVNLKTGEIQTFGPGLRAGEVLFVARADLMRAKLGPYAALADEGGKEGAPAAAVTPTPTAEDGGAEAVAPPTAAPATPDVATTTTAAAGSYDEPLEPGESIHLPRPSIYPLVLGVGLAVALLGLVVGPIEVRLLIVALGFIYLLAGGIGWALENHRAGLASEAGGEHGHHAAH